jgi:hypothetical protein
MPLPDIEITPEYRTMKITKHPVVPDRVRKIDGGFSFLPHRFITDGFFTTLNQHELLLYFLLVLVGDRQGLSYYSQDRLCTMLRMTLDDFIAARDGLIKKSLIAFDGFMFQVLSLPEKPRTAAPKPLRTQQDFENHDPLTIRQIITRAIDPGESDEHQ